MILLVPLGGFLVTNAIDKGVVGLVCLKICGDHYDVGLHSGVFGGMVVIVCISSCFMRAMGSIWLNFTMVAV